MGSLIGSEHPYYCSEGNFYRVGEHTVHSSWAEFLAEMGDADDDLNLLFRWDWRAPENTDDGSHRLLLFYMLQRKAKCLSHEVCVSVDDEPAIRDWLAKRWAKMKQLWAPLADEAG